MELVTGPPQLHATDIVVVANGPGQPLSATAFNLLASNSDPLPPNNSGVLEFLWSNRKASGEGGAPSPNVVPSAQPSRTSLLSVRPPRPVPVVCKD
jgi:hypothetical protein